VPILEFKPDNKTETLSDFPRLKLDTGEKSRILCIEPSPTFAYVHTLRAPKIVDGVAVKHTTTRKDGSTYTDYVKDFIGRPLCLGDLGIVRDKGVDPTNCPACARSTATSEVDPPARRFAMHIIRYGVKPNSWDPRAPFSCEVVIWSFTDQIFNKLTDIQTTWGNLRDHDLLLGPCTDKNFQKFEIMVAPTALWQQHEQIKQIVVETYQENRAQDLEQFCGRRVERRWMEDDIERIAQRWRIANAETPERVDGTEAAGQGSLADGLNDLLGGAAPTQAPPPPLVDSVDLGDLLGGVTPTGPAATATGFADLLGAAQSTTAPATPAPAASPEPVDFDDLLNSL